MLNFILSLFQKKHITGVNPDNRSPEQKQKDWLHEEVATENTVVVRTKEEVDKQSYEVYNQLATSSCVAHATALQITILILQKFGSAFKGMALFIYRLRSNFSNEGMIGDDANYIAVKKGIPDFVFSPQVSTEESANSLVVTQEMYDNALKQKPVGYFTFSEISWDSLMKVVSNGKAIKIFVYGTYKEWAKEYVKPIDKPVKSTAPIRHAIVCLPNSVFSYGGQLYVKIQDSAWFGGLFQRYVSKAFFDAGRCYYASYFTDITIVHPADKPKHTFTQNLKFGMKNDDVKALQDILIYEGFLPAECNTGYFGGLTLKGVKAFQLKYSDDILKPVGLTEPTGLVYARTIAKLNELYS